MLPVCNPFTLTRPALLASPPFARLVPLKTDSRSYAGLIFNLDIILALRVSYAMLLPLAFTVFGA